MRRSVARVSLVVAALVSGPAPVRTAVEVTGISPFQGPPRTLVTISGTDLEFAHVVWDPDSANERTLPVSLGGRMFSVPFDAAPGTYPIVVRDDAGRSLTRLKFVVEGPAPHTHQPRIDYVWPLEASFEDGAMVATLYVQGANIDVGAIVKVNGNEVPTIAHKARAPDLYGVQDDGLGYPIHHFLALAALPDPLTINQAVTVSVHNPDGGSDDFSYTVPASADALDSDGDGLFDAFEMNGFDPSGDGTSDADRFRRDLFVELDVMQGIAYPPASESLDAVRAMFAAAPIINPYVDDGINLVLLVDSTQVPLHSTVIFDLPETEASFPAAEEAPSADPPVTFSTLKEAHFDQDGNIFHYVIWAQKIPVHAGESDYDWAANGPGDDAVIGLNAFEPEAQNLRSQTEVLAHELGHNLGLRHGGATHDRWNPNHLSVMSRSWSRRTGTDIFFRREKLTCYPFYYARAGALEVSGDLAVPPPVNLVVTYSSGMGVRLIESSLDEVKGMCGHWLNWNGSAGSMPTPGLLSIDVNWNGVGGETLDDFPAWPAVRFDGPRHNGNLTP